VETHQHTQASIAKFCWAETHNHPVPRSAREHLISFTITATRKHSDNTGRLPVRWNEAGATYSKAFIWFVISVTPGDKLINYWCPNVVKNQPEFVPYCSKDFRTRDHRGFVDSQTALWGQTAMLQTSHAQNKCIMQWNCSSPPPPPPCQIAVVHTFNVPKSLNRFKSNLVSEASTTFLAAVDSASLRGATNFTQREIMISWN
jgi:hypothetical protein